MRIFKKALKWCGILVAVLVVAVGLLAAHTWYFKPLNINWFFGRAFLQFALESPEMLSSIRVLEPLGIDGHNAHLDDASIESGDELFARLKVWRETLISYDDADLSEQDLLSKRIMLGMLDQTVEAEKFRFHNYPVNQLFGEQNGFPSFMESTHQVDDVEDAEHYVSRLSEVGRKFDQVIDGLRHREGLGILPPQFVVTKVVEEMEAFVDTAIEESILMTALIEKMEEANLPEAEQERLVMEARKEIENTVYPAYQRLIDYMVALDDKVSDNHGVWALPNGDALYEQAIEFFTTTDYSADFIHDFGLAEVERIEGEILAILESEGWDVSGGFTAAIEELAQRPEFYYSDSDEGRDQILADYKAILEEVSTRMDPYFATVPKAELDVKRVPEFREKTAPGAYYQRPAMDGSRPGTFYVNLHDIKATPKYGMRTLAYHEGVPGHHYQLAVLQEQENLPFFRRMLPATAYTEGWALYAEQLAWEMGLQEDPYDNIGRLQGELMRAVRLVVDTGIHHKRWTREQAIDYMKANTGMAQSDVVAEIERYFVLPGQALAYKIGMTKILELRALARDQLGEDFDIREFHDVILRDGGLPLTILEELVREWIEDVKSGSAS